MFAQSELLSIQNEFESEQIRKRLFILKTQMKNNPFIYTTFIALLLLCALAELNVLSSQNNTQKLDIILVGTNDLHGKAYPIVLARRDTGEKYTYGGLVYMARIIEIIKKQNQGNVLYLDAGDQFQGGLQSSKIISSGEIISDYFNHMNLQAGAVGNHEFDFGPDFLDNYMDKLKNDILNANLVDSSKPQLPLKNQQKSKLYRFPIKNRLPFMTENFTDIKIGVIGLSTIQTPYTTSGFIEDLFPGTYKFEAYKQKVIAEAQSLKEQGAHAVVIVSHVGNGCNNNSDYGKWTIQNQQKEIPCEKNDELFRLLDQLPEGMINAVVQGHRHTQSHYFYKGIPIIGNSEGGYYLNTIRLRFSIKHDTAYLKPQDLMIEGPIPVCARVFEGTNRCEYVPPEDLQKAGKLKQWEFHGQKVHADTELVETYQQKYAQKMKIYEYEIVNNYISVPLKKDYLPNSALGNLITNVMANSIKRQNNLNFDFLIMNGGGFRTTWYPGVIRYAELHSMFPFDNQFISFKISGRDLKKMMQIVQNGAKRYYPTWGLQQRFTLDPARLKELQKVRHVHLTSQLKVEQVEAFYTLSELKSTLTNSPIIDDKIYTGVSINFLLNGGDDFNQIVNKPDEIKIMQKTPYSLMMKDVIQIQLQRMGEITEDDLVGPNRMERMIFETAKPYHPES